MISGPKVLRNLELPPPARAKFGSSVFTPAGAVFDPFGQIVTAIIQSKTELRNFGRFFFIIVGSHRLESSPIPNARAAGRPGKGGKPQDKPI